MSIIKNIIIYIALIMSFFIVGDAQNVVATVNGEPTSETQVISVTVKNETGEIVKHSSSEIEGLERKIDGEWIVVGYCGGLEDAVIFYPKAEYTTSVNIKQFGVEKLEPGEYRLVVPYSVKTTEVVRTNAYAYFTVSK